MLKSLRFVLLATVLALPTVACSDDDDDQQNNNGITDTFCDLTDCGAHGTCDADAEECVCDTGYDGAVCDECATDYVDVGGTCVEVECENAGDCDDGFTCNGAETCNANGLCEQGMGVQCDTGQGCIEPSGDCVTEVIADFDDLTLDAESYWSGDATGIHSFISGDATFLNYYDETYGPYWEGFAYANTTDTTTADLLTNQYSAIVGEGEGGSANYAVGYLGFMGIYPELYFTDTIDGYTVAGLWVTNTTAAYLSMRDGDDFAKQFGGPDGTDPDWYKLTIEGLDTNDATTGAVEFYLADYTSGDPTGDYIVGNWTWVELHTLGDIVGLRFSMASTDNGTWGMNTPAYFAIDGIRRVAP